MHIPIKTLLTRQTIPILLGSLIIALILNTVDAAFAHQAGASNTFSPISTPIYAISTLLGLLAGWIGWRIIETNFSNHRTLLAILVPVLTIASFIPDIILWMTKFIPDTSTPGVIGLMIMHLVVVGCGVPAYILASKRIN